MLLQKRIFEWSKGLAPWQRDLLRRLTAGPLDEAQQREVLEILAGAPAAPTPLPLALDDLPADEGEQGRVELTAIRNLSNINCLAPGQTLSFQPGLNAVFGNNGSGKSGYGRLLRRVTRSGEPEEILRNVFDPGAATGPQTADFEIAVDDHERTLTVDLSVDPDRALSAISAFDASRARLFLAKPNVIEHVPRPLRLMRALVLAQDQLSGILRERAQQRRGALPALPAISPDTPAARALAEIDSRTDAADLVRQMTLGDAEQAKLGELEQAAAAIRADQSKRLEDTAKAQATNARSAAQRLIDADKRLGAGAAAELADLRKRLEDANAAERTLADRAFADQRFQATGQGPWREMWFAAERFAQASGTIFPDSDGSGGCPLCQQDLDPTARERLLRFQEFVSSDLRRQAIDLQDQLKARIDALPDLDSLRAMVHAELRGAPQPVIDTTNRIVALLQGRATAARHAAAGEPWQPCEHAVTVDPLIAHADAQDTLAERHAHMRDEQTQRKIMRELDELRARTALVAAQETIAEHVRGLESIARIEQALAMLNTQRITLKLRELQEAAITERIRTAIGEEIRELDPVASRIEIAGKANKGETVIQLKLKEPCRAKVGNVLSDGEQRALSLAFFLAEVAVSDERSTIVLDDPVSSLDHQRREYLAARLAQESKRRQVIVFTHDMAFIHLLQEAADEAGVQLHGQTLRRAFHRAGTVAFEFPTKLLGPAKRLRALRHRLRAELSPKHKHEDPQYEQLADAWLTDLRKAYDQIIEDTVLAGTVRRFSSHVRVRRLHEVKWTPQIATRIDKAMRKASPKAHHESLALHPEPLGPADLSRMLDELESLYGEIAGNSSDLPAEVSTPEPAPTIQAVKASL